MLRAFIIKLCFCIELSLYGRISFFKIIKYMDVITYDKIAKTASILTPIDEDISRSLWRACFPIEKFSSSIGDVKEVKDPLTGGYFRGCHIIRKYNRSKSKRKKMEEDRLGLMRLRNEIDEAKGDIMRLHFYFVIQGILLIANVIINIFK